MKYFILLTLFSISLFSAEAFISAQDLHDKIGSDKLTVLDVGSHGVYHKGHIPTAKYVNIAQYCKRVGDHYEMQEIPHLVKLIRQLGIENDSYVVIYDHNSPNGLLNASYFALVLHRLGHTNLSILNGSYEEWLYEYDGTKVVSAITPSNFVAHPNNELIVDSHYVAQHIDKATTLDARVSKYYFGTYKSPGVYRLGHIEGAVSSYWKNSFLSDNTLAEREILEAIYLHGLKLDPEEEVILYGLDGYEASMNWYVLSKVFNFKKLKVYDASIQEWGNQENTAMVTYAWESPK
ncbi:MAG: rhodanese-like domain-containing protein [Sulfurimonadaceae bacterium]